MPAERIVLLWIVMAFDNGFPGAHGAPLWFLYFLIYKGKLLKFSRLNPACAWLMCPGIFPVMLSPKSGHVCYASLPISCWISLPRRFPLCARAIYFIDFCAGEFVSSRWKIAKIKSLFEKCSDILKPLALNLHLQAAPPLFFIIFGSGGKSELRQKLLAVLWYF